jgi:hypothetical protein
LVLQGNDGCRGSAEVTAAIRAILIGFGDLTLALPARRMQIALAVGTEVKAGVDTVAALRTGIR